MIDGIRLIIFKKKSVYDDIFITPNFACTFNTYSEKNIFHGQNIEPIVLRKKGFNAHLVAIYIDTICRSEIYRQSAINIFTQFTKLETNIRNPIILIKLWTPKYQFLDYIWNEKLNQMLMIRQNLDCGMSWLSTLGGAFSSLGDQFENCAKIAGRISIEQLKLSLQLQDPQLIARCKLYAALSLLQQGYLKITKKMIKDIHEFAIKDNDKRLKKMCQGVWAKLKYCYIERRKKKNNA